MNELFERIDQVIYGLVHDNGGSDKLACKVLVKAGTLNHKVNPTMEEHHLSLKEAIALMIATQDFRLLHVMADQLGFQCIDVDVDHDVADLEFLTLFSKSMASVGDLSRSIHDAMSDGKITQAEVKLVRDSAVDAMSILAKLPQRLAGMSDV